MMKVASPIILLIVCLTRIDYNSYLMSPMEIEMKTKLWMTVNEEYKTKLNTTQNEDYFKEQVDKIKQEQEQQQTSEEEESCHAREAQRLQQQWSSIGQPGPRPRSIRLKRSHSHLTDQQISHSEPEFWLLFSSLWSLASA